MDGQLAYVCIDKHKRKQLPLKPPALPRFFRHSNLKSRHRNVIIIFFSFKLQKVNKRQELRRKSIIGKLRIKYFNYVIKFEYFSEIFSLLWFSSNFIANLQDEMNFSINKKNFVFKKIETRKLHPQNSAYTLRVKFCNFVVIFTI